ncbi:MAG: hypothetical protein PVG39_20155 [Desulfobacteraceae bacterium]|jgi:hypothetical protein
MEKSRTRQLSGLGNFASVEINDDGHDIVHIHFMNTSLRMCSHQLKNYTIMLNEAMMQIHKNDEYYRQMKELFNMYNEMKNLESSERKRRLN